MRIYFTLKIYLFEHFKYIVFDLLKCISQYRHLRTQFSVLPQFLTANTGDDNTEDLTKANHVNNLKIIAQFVNFYRV